MRCFLLVLLQPALGARQHASGDIGISAGTARGGDIGCCMKTNAFPIGGTIADRAWLPQIASGCPEEGNRGCANVWFDVPTAASDGLEDFKGGMIANHALSRYSTRDDCQASAVSRGSNFFDCSAPRTKGAQVLLRKHLVEWREKYGLSSDMADLTDDFVGKKAVVKFDTNYRCCCSDEDPNSLPTCELHTQEDLNKMSTFGGCGGVSKKIAYKSWTKFGACTVFKKDPLFVAFTGKTTEDLTDKFDGNKKVSRWIGNSREEIKCCCSAAATSVKCQLHTVKSLAALSTFGREGCGNLNNEEATFHSFNNMPAETDPELENLGKCVVKLEDGLLAAFD